MKPPPAERCMFHFVVIIMLLSKRILTAGLSGTTEGVGVIDPRLIESARVSSIKKSQPVMVTTATPATLRTTSSWRNRAVIIDSRDDVRSIIPLEHDASTQKSSIIFFSASLSIFATIGIVIFCRKCVRCPTSRHTRRRHFNPPNERSIPINLHDDFSSPKMASSPSASPEHYADYSHVVPAEQVHFQTETLSA